MQMKTIHLSQKEHECEECGKYFGDRGNVSIHMKTNHLSQREQSVKSVGNALEEKEIFGKVGKKNLSFFIIWICVSTSFIFLPLEALVVSSKQSYCKLFSRSKSQNILSSS